MIGHFFVKDKAYQVKKNHEIKHKTSISYLDPNNDATRRSVD